jgi:hypothetical protein
MNSAFSLLQVNGIFVAVKIRAVLLWAQASRLSVCAVYSDVISCKVMRCWIRNLNCSSTTDSRFYWVERKVLAFFKWKAHHFLNIFTIFNKLYYFHCLLLPSPNVSQAFQFRPCKIFLVAYAYAIFENAKTFRSTQYLSDSSKPVIAVLRYPPAPPLIPCMWQRQSWTVNQSVTSSGLPIFNNCLHFSIIWVCLRTGSWGEYFNQRHRT